MTSRGRFGATGADGGSASSRTRNCSPCRSVFQVLAELRFVEFLEQRVIQAFRSLLISSQASEFLFALRDRFEALLDVGDRLSQSGFVLLEPLDFGFYAFQRPESRGGRYGGGL
jgi:hypothetical protein